MTWEMLTEFAFLWALGSLIFILYLALVVACVLVCRVLVDVFDE